MTNNMYLPNEIEAFIELIRTPFRPVSHRKTRTSSGDAEFDSCANSLGADRACGVVERLRLSVYKYRTMNSVAAVPLNRATAVPLTNFVTAVPVT